MVENEEQKAPPLKKKKFRGEVVIEWEMCKGCGFCVEFCPTSALVLSPQFNAKGYHPPILENPDRCTGCGLCGSFCPDFAIFGRRVKVEETPAEEEEKSA